MTKMAKELEQKWAEHTTAVKRCRCPNNFQDARYGKKMRVHNRTKQHEAKGLRGWRCTICGDVKGV